MRACARCCGASKTPAQRLRFADLALDPASRDVCRGDRRIELTRTEYGLLELFLAHPRQVLTRSQIFEQVWGYDFGVHLSNALGVYVGYLRQDRGGRRPRRGLRAPRHRDPAPAPHADVRPGGGRDGRVGVARLLPGDAQRAARAGRPPTARRASWCSASAPCAAGAPPAPSRRAGGPAEFSQVVGPDGVARDGGLAIGVVSGDVAAAGGGGAGVPFLSDPRPTACTSRVITVPIRAWAR